MTVEYILAMLIGGSGYNYRILLYLFLPLTAIVALIFALWPRRHLQVAVLLLCMLWGISMVDVAFEILGNYVMNSVAYPRGVPVAQLGLWIFAGLAVIFGGSQIRNRLGPPNPPK